MRLDSFRGATSSSVGKESNIVTPSSATFEVSVTAGTKKAAMSTPARPHTASIPNSGMRVWAATVETGRCSFPGSPRSSSIADMRPRVRCAGALVRGLAAAARLARDPFDPTMARNQTGR